MENVENTSDPINTGAQRPQPENESEGRNKNLDIIKAYIQRQRVLLERIKLDVDRLHASKPAVAEDPNSALNRILQLNSNNNSDERAESHLTGDGGVGKLSELVSDVLGIGEATITKEIDWESFRGQDVAPLHSLPSWSRAMSTPSVFHQHVLPPPTPSTPSLFTPKTSLSSYVFLNSAYDQRTKKKESVFQVRVREMRVKTVDPALTVAAQFLASLPPDSDDEAIKQARAKEYRDAKEARAREIKETRKMKAQSGQTRSTGHVKKSAHRRKSEASAAAAALRPRGQGGRFKKKEHVVNESLASQTQSAGASADAVTASGRPTSGAQLSTVPSAEDLREDEGGRPQRSRKPSIRFGSVAPSVSSTRSGSSVSTRGNGKAPMDSRMPSPPTAPNGHTRGRLTIRIPARPLAKGSKYDTPDYRDRQASASTSLTGSTSVGITESASTDMTVSGEHGDVLWGGKRYGGWPGNDDLGPTENGLASSDYAVTDFTSQTHFSGIKQEEDENENGMDIDPVPDWDVMDQRNGRMKQEPDIHRRNEDGSSVHPGAADLDEDAWENDSNDSFVCELLPPLPGSSASSSSTSANRGASNGARNGNIDLGRGSSRRGDPSSKTFNVTWSDEEQRLLDMLLVQFPDGTKNRWANISRAMGGTRTPRQVASRVQKYFAKMKKWGIDVG